MRQARTPRSTNTSIPSHATSTHPRRLRGDAAPCPDPERVQQCRHVANRSAPGDPPPPQGTSKRRESHKICPLPRRPNVTFLAMRLTRPVTFVSLLVGISVKRCVLGLCVGGSILACSCAAPVLEEVARKQTMSSRPLSRFADAVSPAQERLCKHCQMALHIAPTPATWTAALMTREDLWADIPSLPNEPRI